MNLSRSLTPVLALVASFIASLPATAEMTLDPGTSVTFHHHDLLGSPVMVSDHKGRVLWYENTRPYGESTGKVSSSGLGHLDNTISEATSQLGYTGHTVDSTSELVYMKARHYDPVIGRFYSNDPVGFKVSNPMMFNRYAYANNNPYKYVDPDGRQSTMFDFEFGYSPSPLMRHQKIEIISVDPSFKVDDIVFGALLLGGAAWVLHNSSDSDSESDSSSNEKGLPTGLVGDQSHPNAGRKNKKSNRHTSGPLTPENGGSVNEDGTGADAWTDFETLTGGNYDPNPDPDSGHIIGDNGIRYRPATDNHAPGIEIPANGGKPTEGLHY